MNIKAMLITAWLWFPALATANEAQRETFLVFDTPVRMERAKLLNESLNTSIDPCTDFYSYVCDRWESNHPLRGGRNSYDVYDEISRDIPEMLSYILGNRTLVESNQTIIDKVTSMYNACLALPDTGDALIRVLNQSGFSAWPILTEGNIFNSSNCTDLLRHMNISAILHLNVVDMKIYAKNPAYPYEVYIAPMPAQEKLMKVSDITAVINNTIKLLNPGIDSSLLQNLTNELVNFSKKLSAMTEDNRLTTAYDIPSLEAKFTNIPISDLLTKEFKKVNITLSDTQEFNVYTLYYEQLNEFLAAANPNTLYNYAGFLSMFSYFEYVNMSTGEAISNKLTQSTANVRNSSQCIALLQESTPDILDYFYVTNLTNPAIKNEVEHIARRVKQAFNETLQNNSWIDNTTRQTLEKKLNNVALGIGYPDTLLNMSVLETSYKYVPSFPLDIPFTEALYYINENIYKMQLRKLQYPQEGDLGWDHSPRDARKLRDHYRTKIGISYELFVPPFFQQGLPRSLNYGGIGGTIAQALAQSFSITGIQYINRTYKGLLTKNFSELVEKKTVCFQEQYKAAKLKMLPELSNKPPYFWKQTLDEDIADNIGLQMALQAYYKVLEQECYGQDTTLASLGNLSGMQLFFISNARPMCRIADKNEPYFAIGRAVFSPARYRVNEAMKNVQAFAKAFNCSLGSPMHPNKTCSLW